MRRMFKKFLLTTNSLIFCNQLFSIILNILDLNIFCYVTEIILVVEISIKVFSTSGGNITETWQKTKNKFTFYEPQDEST